MESTRPSMASGGGSSDYVAASPAGQPLDELDASWNDQGRDIDDDLSPDSFTFSEFGGTELEGMPG
ncbi:hypothetical protein FOZ63_026419, partial [Perkinsus olseni]